MDKPIRGGKYRHYKGKIYKVTGVAKNADTLGEVILFRSTENERQLWCMPLDQFWEKVRVEGRMVPRFEYLNK